MSLFHTHHWEIISATDMNRTARREFTTDDILLIVYGQDVKRTSIQQYTAVVQRCTSCKKLKFYEIGGYHAKALLVAQAATPRVG